MMDNYHFEPINDKVKREQIFEVKRHIAKALPFIEKNLERLVNYLKNEENLNNKIEIDLPIFNSNISFRIFLYEGKIITIVMNYEDLTMLGYFVKKNQDFMILEDVKKIKPISPIKKKISNN